jgi:pimeloyl-ACP methyl ester carboxylesterase
MTIGHTLIGNGNIKVIVLHGWFGDHTAFEPTFNYLDKDTFTYAFMDYRGYGKSKEIPGEHTMVEIAGDAIDLAEQLGWHDFHIVGHSMGAMAAQRIMLDINDPTRIQSVVAVTPVPACGVPFDEGTNELFSGAISNDENRRTILDFTTGNRNSGTWLDYMVKHSRVTTTEHTYGDYLTAWSKTDFSEDIKGNTTPVSVCIGEHDPAFTKDAMRQTYLEWLPNAELNVISNAGHYPMLETPVQMVTLMENFMKRYIDNENETVNQQATA